MFLLSCLIQETEHCPHDLLGSLCPDLCAYLLHSLKLPIPCFPPRLPLRPTSAAPILDSPPAQSSYTSCSASHAWHLSREYISLLDLPIDTLSHSIIVPLRLLYQTLTAPLTISLLLKLIFLCFLSLLSLVLSVFAVGAFFWTWSTGGPIEAEGWLVYG